jgi:hypothetical protein
MVNAHRETEVLNSEDEVFFSFREFSLYSIRWCLSSFPHTLEDLKHFQL